MNPDLSIHVDRQTVQTGRIDRDEVWVGAVRIVIREELLVRVVFGNRWINS
jgi:hypothetical protein